MTQESTSFGSYALRTLVGLTRGTFTVAGYTASFVFKASKATYRTVASRCNVDREQLEAFLEYLQDRGSYIRDGILYVGLKPYINYRNLNILLREIHSQSLREVQRYQHIDSKLLVGDFWSKSDNVFFIDYSWLYKHKKIEVIRTVLWTLVSESPGVIPEDVRVLRRWNSRVNEDMLLHKLTPSLNKTASDGFMSICADGNKECLRELESIHEDHFDSGIVKKKNEKLSNRTISSPAVPVTSSTLDNEESEKDTIDGDPAHDRKPKPKRHGMFYPIKKLFRTSRVDKQTVDPAPSKTTHDMLNRSATIDTHERLFRDPRLQSQNYRDDTNEVRESGPNIVNPSNIRRPDDDCGRGIPDRRRQIESFCQDNRGHEHMRGQHGGVGDADEGLVIHVPCNIQKIVLMKDGRKITIEV